MWQFLTEATEVGAHFAPMLKSLSDLRRMHNTTGALQSDPSENYRILPEANENTRLEDGAGSIILLRAEDFRQSTKKFLLKFINPLGRSLGKM